MPSCNPKQRTAVAAITAVPTFRHNAVGNPAQNATQILNFFPPIRSNPFTLHSACCSRLTYLRPTFIRRTNGHNLEHLLIPRIIRNVTPITVTFSLLLLLLLLLLLFHIFTQFF
jgi:hypothetical protein